jgi:hypothetical protein
LTANNSTLADWFRESFHKATHGIQSDVTAGSIDDKGIRLLSLLKLATALFQQGFYEIAYRLELYCRTVERSKDFISLDGDVTPHDASTAQVVGLAKGVETLPAFVKRGTLTGAAGAGKTMALLQMENMWSLPRIASTGFRKPVWLPIYLPLDRRGGQDLNGKLRDELRRNARLQADLLRDPVSLEAHILFSRVATPETMRWLVSSPALHLFDSVDSLSQAQFERLQDALVALDIQYPEAGVLSASRVGSGLQLTEGHRIEIRPMNDEQVEKLRRSKGGSPSLRDLLGVNNKSIAYHVRNPYLFSLICDIADTNANVKDWNLFKTL